MNRKAIRKVVHHFFRKQIQQLKKISVDGESDHFHRLRVSYKKLRAFIRLLNSSNINSLKLSRKMKKLYHEAGVLRDMQLQYERIEKRWRGTMNAPGAYLHSLTRKIEKAHQWFLEHDCKKYVEKNKKAVEHNLPKLLSIAQLAFYINQQWKIVQSMVANHYLDDEHLHAVRKSLKDIFYNVEIYNENFSLKGLFVLSKEQMANLKTLLDTLGNYQDLRRTIELLNLDDIKKINKADQQQLTEMRLQVTQEKQTLKKQVIDQLENLLLDA